MLIVLCLPLVALSSAARAAALRAVPARSFYLTEAQGELVLFGDEGLLSRSDLQADVLMGDRPLAQGAALVRGRRVTVPFDLTALPAGETELTCVLRDGTGEKARLAARVTKLPPLPNAVQIDRISGGLIVNGLPFLPFGFYCYSPVQPTLAEEEVVKGFNEMSPYQWNDPKRLAERRAYLDRCAQLGMKVHYQVQSIAVSGRKATPEQRAQREQALRAEVKALRDHPALLAWYINDEPDGNDIRPDDLARTYRLVHELDPYHPVTVVFMIPDRAQQYLDSVDVIMTDPYPIPRGPVTAVASAIGALASRFGAERPVWLVPQAFGGNEWWTREPTAAEERAMTYLGLLNGATGVQYFVRHGLNGFPKSTDTWAECGRLALEVQELMPALLSHEARPRVAASAPIQAGAWQDRGMIYVLAVNTENRPQPMQLTLTECSLSGPADVLFENRTVKVKGGAIDDFIDAYGTRAYRLAVASAPADDVAIAEGNLIVNPSFEDNPGRGAPEGCYADVGKGRGATYFVDPRVARHGRHSVRLVSPADGQGVVLRPYAPPVTQGKTYRLSVWAKAAPSEASAVPARPSAIDQYLGRRPSAPRWPVLKLSLPGVGETVFPLTAEWREYAIQGPIMQKMSRAWVSLGLVSAGTAWIDLLQFVEVH